MNEDEVARGIQRVIRLERQRLGTWIICLLIGIFLAAIITVLMNDNLLAGLFGFVLPFYVFRKSL